MKVIGKMVIMKEKEYYIMKTEIKYMKENFKMVVGNKNE